MTADVLLYRLYRLRRLILVAVLPPALVVVAVASAKGPAALVLLALAVGVPLAHALRYPNVWFETLSVSLVLSVLLALAGAIGPDVGILGLALRLIGLFLLGAVLFLAAVALLPALLAAGPPRPITARARRRTRLSPAEAKARITLHPSREDDRVSCGAPDADGTFAVSIRHSVPSLTGSEPEPLEILLFAQVLTSTDSVHEVMSVTAGAQPPAGPCGQADSGDGQGGKNDALDDDAPPEITVTRHVFTPGRRGTLVELAETGPGMTRFLALGFWLQDCLADHLTDEIDRAEGRAPRANRFAPQDQLVADLARALVGPQPVQPAE